MADLLQIAHYGLPAAGVILLAMIKRRETSDAMRSSHLRVWQDLTILAAEIQMGSIVRPEEPDYALLFKATSTIQSFLESSTLQQESSATNLTAVQAPQALDDCFPMLNPDPWNLEMEFWDNLAGHPYLSNADLAFPDL